MKTKVYTEDSSAEILRKASEELGPEIFVYGQKDIQVKKGLFRKKRQVQATVIALEDDDIKRIQEDAVENYKKVNIHNKVNSSETEELSKQMKEFHQTLRGMSIKIENIDTKNIYPKGIQELESRLKKHDTDEKTIDKIIRSITVSLTREEQESAVKVTMQAKKYIEGLCTNVKSISKKEHSGSKISMFVGTTGVGKTTTASKLATILQLSDQKRNSVGVITLDTFREGAIQQLTNLCDYTDIPVKIANSAETFKECLDAFSEYQHIFIDTTGRSQHNIADIKKIKDILGDYMNIIDETYLVMSATTKFEDMKDIYESFKWLNINRIIFSKTDETNKLGNIISFIDQYPSVSLSYITIGQRVPSDIELILPEKFSDLILNNQNITQII